MSVTSPLRRAKISSAVRVGLVLVGLSAAAPTKPRIFVSLREAGAGEDRSTWASVPAVRAPPPFPQLAPDEFLRSYSCFQQGPSRHCLSALFPSHLSFLVRGERNVRRKRNGKGGK